MDLEILNMLEKQHRDAERVLKQLGKEKSADQQQPLVDKLRTMLTEHMRIEEADVYPELQHVDVELEVEAQNEHDLARKGLQQLDDMVGKPGFGAALAMVEAGIAHHVEEEEQEVFPRLRKELSDNSANKASVTKEELKRALADVPTIA